MVENTNSEKGKVRIREIKEDFQISIPEEVRKKLKLKIGDCIAFVEKDGKIIISKVVEMRQLDNLIQNLVCIALQDGKISLEEKKMIKSIYSNIETFKRAYRKAWVNNKITAEEKNLLTDLWKKIYDKTVETIQKEKKITLDEMKLLLSVFRTIYHSSS